VKRETAEGNLDRTGKPLKFKSDVDSNWTVRDDVPFYGMKEHAAIDVESGLILSTYLSQASEHDTNYFQSVAVRGIQGKEVPPKVYADKGYCSQDNREFLSQNQMADGIMAPPRRGQEYYVYAFKSALSQRVYIGQTDDMNNRLLSHNAGYVNSTRNETPWELIAYQVFSTREEARWMEYNLKRSLGKRNKWVEQNGLGATPSEGARITGMRS
jgi:predicted GIY-YIG superfamily endonuclease